MIHPANEALCCFLISIVECGLFCLLSRSNFASELSAFIASPPSFIPGEAREGGGGGGGGGGCKLEIGEGLCCFATLWFTLLALSPKDVGIQIKFACPKLKMGSHVKNVLMSY